MSGPEHDPLTGTGEFLIAAYRHAQRSRSWRRRLTDEARAYARRRKHQTGRCSCIPDPDTGALYDVAAGVPCPRRPR